MKNSRKNGESIAEWRARVRAEKNPEQYGTIEPAVITAARSADKYVNKQRVQDRVGSRMRWFEDNTIGKVKNLVFGSPDTEIRDTVGIQPSNYIIRPEINIDSKFNSDTTLTGDVRTSRSASAKKGHPVKNELSGIMLHHTGTPSLDEATQIFLDTLDRGGQSAHVIISPDGTRRVFAEPEQVTFHAGQSAHNVNGVVRDNANDYMVGVEFLGNTNTNPLTDSQINSFIEYAAPIIQKYEMPFENIISHRMATDLYDKYTNPDETRPRKIDIDPEQMKRVQEALMKYVYYKK